MRRDSAFGDSVASQRIRGLCPREKGPGTGSADRSALERSFGSGHANVQEPGTSGGGEGPRSALPPLQAFGAGSFHRDRMARAGRDSPTDREESAGGRTEPARTRSGGRPPPSLL